MWGQKLQKNEANYFLPASNEVTRPGGVCIQGEVGADPPELEKRTVRASYWNVFTSVCHSFCPPGGGGLHPVGRGQNYQPPHRILQDTVSERAVHILLECILILVYYRPEKYLTHYQIKWCHVNNNTLECMSVILKVSCNWILMYLFSHISMQWWCFSLHNESNLSPYLVLNIEKNKTQHLITISGC